MYYNTGSRTHELIEAKIADFQGASRTIVLGKHKRTRTQREPVPRTITLNADAYIILERRCQGRDPKGASGASGSDRFRGHRGPGASGSGGIGVRGHRGPGASGSGGIGVRGHRGRGHRGGIGVGGASGGHRGQTDLGGHRGQGGIGVGGHRGRGASGSGGHRGQTDSGGIGVRPI